MKRYKFLIPLLIVLLFLEGCSNNKTALEIPEKEGISPYELSEDEFFLLESFGMADTSHIFTFHAPKEAITVHVNVYQLAEENTWKTIGSGDISIGEERDPVEQLSGTFAMQLQENYSIDFNINCAGRLSFKTDEIVLENETVGSTKGFLNEFQKIELNTEIPVAIMVYDSGTSMQNYTPKDYFEPSKFEGMDLVQVVTLEFSDSKNSQT